MNHTPGPWQFLPDQDNQTILDGEPVAGTIYAPDEEIHIARVWSDVDEQLANAHLIAAAPTLLEAAERALALIEEGAPGWDVAKDLLRAAIYEAKNGSR